MTDGHINDQTDLIIAGDHLVILYDDKEEITSYVANYLKSSLLRNERCIYIKGDAEDDKIIKSVRQVSKTIDSGDFLVLDPNDIYSKDDDFNPDKMIDILYELVKNTIADGYEGLSVSGELSSILKHSISQKLIIEYEWKFNEFVSKNLPITALCRYNLNNFSDEVLVNVMQLHPYLVYKNETHENPFFIPTEGYKKNDIAHYQVVSWLKNIELFTNAKNRFYNQLAKKKQEMDQLHNQLTKDVVNSVLELLSIHDRLTTNHSQNVASLSQEFAKYMGMNDTFITKIYYAGLVHDIGKILIPKSVLSKVGSLNYDEYMEVQKHPEYAYKALVRAEMSEDIAKAVRAHHERWDGCGYPDGLKKDEIPIMARMLAITDSYDAMVNDRVFREGYGPKVAREEIFANAGTKYDPYLASEYIKMLKNNNYFV